MNKHEIKEESLNKYSDKDEVLRKWIQLNKKLNKNKDTMYYNGVIIEAIALVETIVDNMLKDDINVYSNKDRKGNNVNFYDKINALRNKGFDINDDDMRNLRKIKWDRNIGAHFTVTYMGEIITFNSVRYALEILGTILCKLKTIENEDIVISVDKLIAQEGEVLDDVCKLDEFIGEGASGRVFKGFHSRLGHVTAVKEIKHNTVDEELIENEKKILLTLKHQGIPSIYDILSYNRTYYLVMEYIEGVNLDESISKSGALSLKASVDVMKQLCDIIEYLHKNNIVYNDLKPSNIMIDDHNKVTLIDFGIAKNTHSGNEINNMYSGTIAYSSPEQLRGSSCSTSNDIYSLGAVLYFLIEGENPVMGREQRFKKSTDERLITVMEKAMAAPNGRYSSVAKLREDLKAIEMGRPINAAIDKTNNISSMASNKINNNAKSQENNLSSNKSQKLKGKHIAVISIVIGSILLVSVLYGGYSLTNKIMANAAKAKNPVETSSPANNSNESSEKKDKKDTAAADNTKNANNAASNSTAGTGDKKAGANNGENKPAASTGEAFKGKLKVNVKSYKIDGSDITIKVNVQNNFNTEVSFWPDRTYIINEAGKVFKIDIYKHLRNGGSKFDVVSGENKDFEFYLTGYEDSKELTFKMDQIWSMDPRANDEIISIKLK